MQQQPTFNSFPASENIVPQTQSQQRPKAFQVFSSLHQTSPVRIMNPFQRIVSEPDSQPGIQVHGRGGSIHQHNDESSESRDEDESYEDILALQH